MSLEGERLAELRWKEWGPYLAERAWGTVREDYSAGGDAWRSFPHEQARSRAYRWSEDGLGGICDIRQRLCLAFAFWNGRDPILKERIFGLAGPEGNHGEDAKELWWYLDSTPTHSFMRWRYVYPQAEFPYAQLVAENARRGRHEPEYELVDTGVLDEGYWDVAVDYAKAAPDDVCVRVTVRNAGPAEATLEVLPTLWYRNTWSWDGSPRPELRADGAAIVADGLTLLGSGSPEPLFCENESNAPLLWGAPATTPHPKDGIGDHVVHGLETVNPALRGTKAALRYRLTVAAGELAELRLRLAPGRGDLGDEWERTFAQREREADAFYGELLAGADDEAALIARQAFAGMLWSKQFFHYDVERWLDGDPAQPAPPRERTSGRNAGWGHLNNADVISMPDKWEYPWYAAWDLAFHCVPLAHVDPELAKHQLLLLCREWYMHPNGQLPAYEWAFGDVNPPVHAWAAMRVFELDGSRDYGFLARILHKLLLNFTWWVNRKDAEGENVFEGGFLGLDNIGPLDRSALLPVCGRLEQSDGTAWMAMYCLDLLDIAITLAKQDRDYEDVATKFFEHFALIARAMNEKGLWDEEDGFYYDQLRLCEHDERVPLRVRSMVGLIPLYATQTVGRGTLEALPDFAKRFHWFLANRPEYADVVGNVNALGEHEGRLLAIVSPGRLRRILATMLDEAEFLSPYGLRAVSRRHAAEPFAIELGGARFEVDYEPAESTSGLFGGNSNWRGPVWLPVNYLAIEALRRFHRYLGDDFAVPCGGNELTLAEVADELSRRLVAIFRRDDEGRRPVFGGYERLQRDFGDRLLFHEYFHGDTGAGLGASHQTGWTGLVADLVVREAAASRAARERRRTPRRGAPA
jgi:hypothetical protein